MKLQPIDPHVPPTEIIVWFNFSEGVEAWWWHEKNATAKATVPCKTKGGAKRSAWWWAKRNGVAIRIVEP